MGIYAATFLREFSKLNFQLWGRGPLPPLKSPLALTHCQDIVKVEWISNDLQGHFNFLLSIPACVSATLAVVDTVGLQWFQLKPPLKSVRAPNLFMNCVSNKITNSYA